MASKTVISYKASIEKDLRQIGESNAARILDKLEKDLSVNPNRGVPLKGEFDGLLKHRIGDYRIIYTKISEDILVLRIAHRKDATAK